MPPLRAEELPGITAAVKVFFLRTSAGGHPSPRVAGAGHVKYPDPESLLSQGLSLFQHVLLEGAGGGSRRRMMHVAVTGYPARALGRVRRSVWFQMRTRGCRMPVMLGMRDPLPARWKASSLPSGE